jgi:hypothetical protein
MLSSDVYDAWLLVLILLHTHRKAQNVVRLQPVIFSKQTDGPLRHFLFFFFGMGSNYFSNSHFTEEGTLHVGIITIESSQSISI